MGEEAVHEWETNKRILHTLVYAQHPVDSFWKFVSGRPCRFFCNHQVKGEQNDFAMGGRFCLAESGGLNHTHRSPRGVHRTQDDSSASIRLSMAPPMPVYASVVVPN